MGVPNNYPLILDLVHLIVEFKLRLEFNLIFKQTNKHKQIFFLARVQAPHKQLNSFTVSAPSWLITPKWPTKRSSYHNKFTIYHVPNQIDFQNLTSIVYLCNLQYCTTQSNIKIHTSVERVVALTSLQGWMNHALTHQVGTTIPFQKVFLAKIMLSISGHSTRDNCTNASVVLGPFFFFFPSLSL